MASLDSSSMKFVRGSNEKVSEFGIRAGRALRSHGSTRLNVSKLHAISMYVYLNVINVQVCISIRNSFRMNVFVACR